jgi:hypothetical protein
MSEHTVSRHRLIAYDRNKQVFEFDFNQSRFNASERFFNEYGGQNDPARRLNPRGFLTSALFCNDAQTVTDIMVHGVKNRTFHTMGLIYLAAETVVKNFIKTGDGVLCTASFMYCIASWNIYDSTIVLHRPPSQSPPAPDRKIPYKRM